MYTIVQFCILLYCDLTTLYIFFKQDLGLKGSAFKEFGFKFLVRPLQGIGLSRLLAGGRHFLSLKEAFISNH